MPEFSRSATIPAPQDELFEFLSKVDNLPKYFHALTHAHHTRGDEVHVAADEDQAGGHGDAHGEVHGDAWFTIDADNRSLAWGSEGPNNYKGELSVSATGDATSTVTVTLHTEHDEAEQINAGIEETLQNIEGLATNSQLG